MLGRVDAFAAIADRLLAEPDVTAGTGFGSRGGLRSGGKIFAIRLDDALVVKLPAARCARLLADGAVMPWDRGKGTPLKEWVAVPERDAEDWAGFADEALAYARAAQAAASR
jgi:hypothetical protein